MLLFFGISIELAALISRGAIEREYVVDGFQHVESHFLHTTMRSNVDFLNRKRKTKKLDV